MSLQIQPQLAFSSEVNLHNFNDRLPEFRSRLIAWFREQGRDLPWRHTHDPYAILVSEIMLQQTQVITVIDYYNRWMKRFPTVSALANAPEADVLHAWQGLGYYSRARNLHRAAQKILEQHGGVFPRDVEQIRTLPGVGRYTAGAVATFAFDLPEATVDANIARVIARLINSSEPIDSASGQDILWENAAHWQPEQNARLFNSALMELGALVCTPRGAACLVCPVRAFCTVSDPAIVPVKKPRRKTELMNEECGWIVCNDQVLLEQQTGRRWKGLWKLPLLHEPHSCNPLVTLDYPFTHHKVTLSVFPASIPLIMQENQRWFPIQSLDEAAMPSPHRRALKRLLKHEHRLQRAKESRIQKSMDDVI
jgi:A/G-specific adenine glycosylase